MLGSVLARRTQTKGEANGVRVEKTDHGWRIYYDGNDPETRYLSPSPRELARLKRRAEKEYERRKRAEAA